MDMTTVETRLRSEEERLTRLIASIDNPEYGLKASLKDSIGELASYDNHTSDSSAETFERSKDISLKDTAKALLSQTRNALQALREGSYGTCQSCGKEIDPERLNAIPSALMCTECKGNQEAARGDSYTRPIEELAIGHPLSLEMYDEAWRLVAQYGNANSHQDDIDAGEEWTLD